MIPKNLCARAMTWLLAGALPAVAAAEGSLLERLPAETLYAVEVGDLSELEERWKAHPLHDAAFSPRLETFRAELAGSWEGLEQSLEQTHGIDAGALAAAFRGSAVYFSTDLRRSTQGDVILTEWDMCFLAEMEDANRPVIESAIAKLLEKVPADAKRSLDTFGGIQVFTIEFFGQTPAAGGELGGLGLSQEIPFVVEYALTDEYLVVCEGRNKPLRGVLTALGDGSTGRLGDSPRYRTVASGDDARGTDLNAYVDLGRLVEFLLGGRPSEEAAKLRQLGTDQLGGALFSMWMEADGISQAATVEIGDGPVGVAALLRAGEPLTAGRLAMVPANALEFGLYNINVGQAWLTLRELLRAIEPSSETVIGGVLGTARGNFQLDIEADLLANITGEHVFYTVPLAASVPAAADSPMARHTVALVATRNSETTTAALDRLMTVLSGEMFQMPLERLEGTAFPIWTVKESQTQGWPDRPGLALTSEGLLFATGLATLQEAARRLTSQPTDGIAGSSEFEALRPLATGSGLRGMAYTSPESLARQLELAGTAFGMTTDMLGVPVPFDPTTLELPDAAWWKEVFGGTISWTRVDDGTLRLRNKVSVRER